MALRPVCGNDGPTDNLTGCGVEGHPSGLAGPFLPCLPFFMVDVSDSGFDILMYGARKPAALAKLSNRDELKSGSPVGFFIAFIVIVVTCVSVIIYRGVPEESPIEKRTMAKKCEGGWKEIVIPSDGYDSRVFKYSTRVDNTNRDIYNIELARYLGLCPYDEDFGEKKVLVVGSHTSIGETVIRQLKKRNISVIALKHSLDLDFSSEDVVRLFDNVSLSFAIVIFDFMKFNFAKSDGAGHVMELAYRYCDGLGKLLFRKNVKTIFGLLPPFIESLSEMDLCFGMKLVFLPNVVDLSTSFSSDNILLKIMRDCDRAGKSIVEVMNGTRIESVTADEVAQFLISQMENFSPGRIQISGSTSVSLEEALQNVKCDIKRIPYPHSLKIVNGTGDKIRFNGSVTEMIRHSLSTFRKCQPRKPYLSILVTCSGDDSVLKRLQESLNRISVLHESQCAVDFEVIIQSSTSLRHSIQVPQNLKDKVIWSQTDTFELLKNSSGDFVMFMSPEIILSRQFFSLLESHPLNPGILYLLRPHNVTKQLLNSLSLDDIIQLAEEPWKQKLFFRDETRPKSLEFRRGFHSFPNDLVILSHELAEAIIESDPPFYNTSRILPGFITQSLPCAVTRYPYSLIV